MHMIIFQGFSRVGRSSKSRGLSPVGSEGVRKLTSRVGSDRVGNFSHIYITDRAGSGHPNPTQPAATSGPTREFALFHVRAQRPSIIPITSLVCIFGFVPANELAFNFARFSIPKRFTLGFSLRNRSSAFEDVRVTHPSRRYKK